MRRINGKRGLEQEVLIAWIVAVLFLLLSFVAYMVLSGKAEGMIDFIKSLFRLRR